MHLFSVAVNTEYFSAVSGLEASLIFSFLIFQRIVMCWELVLQRWHGYTRAGVVQCTKYLPKASVKVSDKSRFHLRIKSEMQGSESIEDVGGMGEMHVQSISNGV